MALLVSIIADIASVGRPAPDQVWEFRRSQPGLHADGNSISFYRHPENRNAQMSAPMVG
jgi:hypothetical protein